MMIAAMHIAIFTDTYSPHINGVVTSTRLFTQSFEDKGHQVSIFAPKIKGHVETDSRVIRVPSVAFPFQKEYQVAFPWRDYLKIDFSTVDMIHAQTPFSLGVLALWIGRRYKIPVVHSYHTFFSEYVHYIPVLPKRFLRWGTNRGSASFCNRCAHVIAPSPQMKAQLETLHIRPPISVVPTGLSAHQRIASPTEIDAFIARYSIPKTHKICSFVGRLAKEKNVSFLIEAFYRIHLQQSDTHLLVVGDGPEREAMESLANELSIRESVTFTGYIEHHDIFTVFQASTLYLFPSKTETQGLTLLECLSVGTPAVCIDAMGVKDILGDNQGGFLCPDSLDDFSEKAVSLLSNHPLYLVKVEEAINRSKLFLMDHLADQLLSIYSSILTVKK